MNGKTALVTGGIGGIGSAICTELAAQGHRVVAGYYPAEAQAAQQWQEAMREQGLDVGIAAGDVADFDDARRMVDEVRECFGPIAILVNCAGGGGRTDVGMVRSFSDTWPSDWAIAPRSCASRWDGCEGIGSSRERSCRRP